MATDYEQKYKEALERARKLYNDAKANEYKSDMEDYESIFPELAESYDDRMMREFNDCLCEKIECLTNDLRDEKDRRTLNMLCYILTKVKDRLKKQKEQKPAEYLDKDKIYAIMKKLHDLSFSKDILINSKEYKQIDEITHDVRSLLDYPINQQSTEWSEEDKRKLNRIYSIIGWAMDEHAFSSCKKLLGDKEGVELQDFLRSIAKPKQEWSEEDEKDMAHIIRILDDCYVYGTHDLSKTDHENLVNKLKSLRPSWKPSEEQMKALSDACCIAFEEERCFHPSFGGTITTPNTQSVTATATLDGNTSVTDGKPHDPSFTD